MRKLCLLWLAAFLLWSCGDSESTTSATNVFDLENSHLTKSSSSEVQSSSSSESDEDESYNSSTEENEESSSSDQKSSSSSSNSKTKSSSSSNSITSSSSVEHGNPLQTSSSSICISEVSPIHFLPLTAKPNADKSEFFFYGSADLGWPCIPENTYPEPYFTSVQLVLAHVNEHGQNEVSPIKLQYTPPTLPATVINLAEMGVRISDSAKTQCGNFKLFVDFTATDDPNNPDRFLGWDSIEFVREPIYCEAEPKSSSSAAIDSVVRKVEIRQFNGLMSTSETRGYSFKNDAEVPKEQAQIQVTENKNGELILHGVNGYKVVKYENANDRNWDDDWSAFELPPSPAHTSDFRFTNAKLADSAIGFDCDAFWIVLGPAFNDNTGEDFYAVTLETKERPDANGVRQLEIIYCKK